MPRPRPFEAPVTRAVLPSMPRSIAPRSQSPERFTQLQRGCARFRYARRRSMGGHLAVTDIYLRRRQFVVAVAAALLALALAAAVAQAARLNGTPRGDILNGTPLADSIYG